MENRAKEILSSKHMIVGREIEDCQYGKEYVCSDGRVLKGGEYHMIMVRPFTKDSLAELFSHGKKYCSKFEIFCISDDIISGLRPDYANYIEEEFEFELNGNWDEEEYVKEILESRKAFGDIKINNMYTQIFSKYVVDQLHKTVDIVKLDKNSYNIVIDILQEEDINKNYYKKNVYADVARLVAEMDSRR